MDNIRQVISDVFNTKNTSITFSEPFFTDEVRADVLFKSKKTYSARWANFLILKISGNKPFFHSIYMQDYAHLDKFNQMFQMNQYSRKKLLSINDILKSFENNKNFSRFLRFNQFIKNNEFYTFQKPADNLYSLKMLEKDKSRNGITSCVNGQYRCVAQYQFIRNFAVTRKNTIVLFPTVEFYYQNYPLSLYFDVINEITYKLPDDLSGLYTVEDIVEASTVFNEYDIDQFTDNILMNYVKNLHSGLYNDFLTIPKENLSDKIDLLMMSTI